MGTIFILAGSLMGFVGAVLGIAFGGLSLLMGLAIWVLSGPAAVLVFAGVILPLSRAARHQPSHHLA